MATAEARENLLAAIREYEAACGDDARYREIRADLVNLERQVRATDDYEGERENPSKNFDRVAERHRERIEDRRKDESSSTSNDDQAPSDEGTGDAEGDKSDGKRPMRKRRG